MTSKPGKQTVVTHIAQYLKKYRQSDNEIWSVDRIREILSFKNHVENPAGRLVPEMLGNMCVSFVC